MPTHPTPETLLLQYIADTYLAKYPQESRRIARAVALVEAGNVTLMPDGTATVRSQKGQATYKVHGTCQCDDQSAPEGRCKHRWAKTFFRKVTCLLRKARYAVYLDGNEQVHGIAWPSLGGDAVWYAADDDIYAERMREIPLAHVIVCGRLERSDVCQ